MRVGIVGNVTSGDQFNRLCAILEDEYYKPYERNWNSVLLTAAILCQRWPTAAPKLAHDLADLPKHVVLSKSTHRKSEIL